MVMCSHVGLQNYIPGQFGVTLFFFLSGYLITTLLRNEINQHGRIDLIQFYLRRVFRILPPMYITILFMVALSLSGAIHAPSWHALPIDFAFLSNYFPISGIPIGLWSLAVEEHFYIAFPLILALLTRRLSFPLCAAAIAIACVIVLGIRIWEAQRLHDLGPINLWTHTRMDSILFGSILALWNNPVLDKSSVLPSGAAGYLIATALLVPSFTIRDEAFRQTYRYTIQGCGLLILFNTAIRDTGWVAAVLNSKVMRLIASLSYTLYLVHVGFVLAFSPIDGRHSILATLAAFAASVAYALLMHRYVEQPLNDYRRRIERKWAENRKSHAPQMLSAERP